MYVGLQGELGLEGPTVGSPRLSVLCLGSNWGWMLWPSA